MIEIITNGITKALFNEFGSDYAIYTENIEQGLNEPCFFVKCISPASEKRLKSLRQVILGFAVQYFPNTHDFQSECMAVFERMVEALDLFSVNEIIDDVTLVHKLNCYGFNAEVNDGVMTVTFNVNTYVNIVESPNDKMQTISSTERLR